MLSFSLVTPTIDWDPVVKMPSKYINSLDMLVADSGGPPVLIDHYSDIDLQTLMKISWYFSKALIMNRDKKVKIAI